MSLLSDPMFWWAVIAIIGVIQLWGIKKAIIKHNDNVVRAARRLLVDSAKLKVHIHNMQKDLKALSTDVSMGLVYYKCDMDQKREDQEAAFRRKGRR